MPVQQRNSATDILDYVLAKQAHIMRLPLEEVPLNSEIADQKLAEVSDSKLATVLHVVDQQNALISGLRSASLNSMKTAAALAEAIKLAEEGAIDISDVIDFARRSLIDGNVKVSSVQDIFDQSPGEAVGPVSVETAGKSASQVDPLTSFLRSSRTS